MAKLGFRSCNVVCSCIRTRHTKSVREPELVVGVIKSESKAAYVEMMRDLVARGAECIILGCTEITLLIGQDDTSVPVFDTTAIHAVAALEAALART